MPALNRLDLGLAGPHSLSEALFRMHIAPLATKFTESYLGKRPAHQISTPFLPSLSTLGLWYRRWLRGAERSTLIPALGDIKASCNALTIYLIVDKNPYGVGWFVRTPVKSFPAKSSSLIRFGISGPGGITRLQAFANTKYLPFREAEYLHLDTETLSVDILSTFRCLLKLRTSGWCAFEVPEKPPPHDLPFCNTLRVFDVHEFYHSY